MTAYNRENFISEAIESVLNSTYTNFELIIVDDCSIDNTVEIAKSFEKADSRIKVYVNDKNLDQFPNRNKAAEYANGKYIKYLDSDDRIYEWGLGYCVESMEKYPDAGMAMLQVSKSIEQEYFLPQDAIHRHFFKTRFLNIGPSGTIINSNAFRKAGFYNTNYGVPSDMYFNLKMASQFPVVLLKKEFFYYRVHDGQEIKNIYSYLYNNYPYLRDALALPEMPLDNKQKNQLLIKAKKEFFSHSVRYIINTGKIIATLKALKHSGLGFTDFLQTLKSNQK